MLPQGQKRRLLTVGAEPDAGHVLHWPAGFSPECADVWARSELAIDAGPAAVFSHLVSVGCWEQDFPGIRNVHVLTPGHERLEPASVFEFEIDGLHISAQVIEFVARSRLAWFGQGIDISIYHAWVVSGEVRRSRVLAGFAARGPAAIALREPDPASPQRALDQWVAYLKAAAERAGR